MTKTFCRIEKFLTHFQKYTQPFQARNSFHSINIWEVSKDRLYFLLENLSFDNWQAFACWKSLFHISQRR